LARERSKPLSASRPASIPGFQWFVATIAILVLGVVVAVAAVRALGAPGAAC
jgi:hypothetical protein